MKCQGCGMEKDATVLEVYPYAEDYITNDPIAPCIDVEVEGRDGTFRNAAVCFECFHKLQPDMWISQMCWESIDPKIPFDDLKKV